MERDVTVVVRGGVIDAVFPQRSAPEFSPDMPVVHASLLLPAFINAHCHIEYSWMQGQLQAGKAFGDWLRDIFEMKRSGKKHDAEIAPGMQRGIDQLIGGGCATVFDCGTTPQSEDALVNRGLRTFQFVELIGLDDAAGPREDAKFRTWLDRRRDERLLGRGVNPHAPYSVGPALRDVIARILRDHPDLPAAWHMHESVCEMEYFRDNCGAIAEFFREANLAAPYGDTPPGEPMKFLRDEGMLERVDAFFHHNFPEKDAQLDATMPKPLVVHCPGTHRYFSRPEFPLKALEEMGYRVALGTDSLASGDTLSMLEMMRLMAEEFPALAGPDLLAMATTTPADTAMAGMWRGKLGRISPGCAADFAALDAGPGADLDDLKSVLTNRETRVALTVCGGALLPV